MTISDQIPDRAPTTIWCLSHANLDIHVRTAPGDHVVLVGDDGMGARSAIVLTRREARLFAKRINQCLDATVKR